MTNSIQSLVFYLDLDLQNGEGSLNILKIVIFMPYISVVVRSADRYESLQRGAHHQKYGAAHGYSEIKYFRNS